MKFEYNDKIDTGDGVATIKTTRDCSEISFFDGLVQVDGIFIKYSSRSLKISEPPYVCVKDIISITK